MCVYMCVCMYMCMYIKKKNEERVLHSILYTCNCTNLAFSKNIYLHTIIHNFLIASFPGPAQLSVTTSTASDRKLGRGWE